MARLAIKTVVDATVSSAMLLASASVLFFVWQNAQAKTPSNPAVGPVPKSPVELLGSATEGSPDAPTAIVVFSDFECPFCRAFAESVLPTFRDQYVDTGRVLMSFRHLPLKIHQLARPAAQAGVCAQAQGKFWSLHDTLFAQPSSLREIDKAIADIGADVQTFLTCKSSGQASQTVDADLALAKTLEIRATPTFLVGRNDGGRVVHVATRFTGAPNYEAFMQKLGSFQGGPGR